MLPTAGYSFSVLPLRFWFQMRGLRIQQAGFRGEEWTRCFWNSSHVLTKKRKRVLGVRISPSFQWMNRVASLELYPELSLDSKTRFLSSCHSHTSTSWLHSPTLPSSSHSHFLIRDSASSLCHSVYFPPFPAPVIRLSSLLSFVPQHSFSLQYCLRWWFWHVAATFPKDRIFRSSFFLPMKSDKTAAASD